MIGTRTKLVRHSAGSLDKQRQVTWVGRGQISVWHAAAGWVFTSFTLIAIFAGCAVAQVPSVGDTTSPPPTTPGHALIVGPHELVNPANGSVSLTFPVAVPPGRQLTIPFNVFYSSNAAQFVTNLGLAGEVGWQVQNEPRMFERGGWSYGVPKLSNQYQTIQVVPDPEGLKCTLYSNFVYTDPGGQPHALGLSNTTHNPYPQTNPCDPMFPYPSQIGTSFNDNCPVLFDGTLTACAGDGPLRAFSNSGKSVHVFDPSGSVVNFGLMTGDHSGTNSAIAGDVSDRNGNTINFSVDQSGNLTETDTLGRPAVVASSFFQASNIISVSASTSAYVLNWGTATSNFTESPANLRTDPNTICNVNLNATGSNSVVTSLTAPDGTYQFAYDPAYGLLGKLTYPNGGYVRYVWGLSTNSEFGTFAARPATAGGWDYSSGIIPGCSFNYGVPMITDRYVSSDGVHEQQWQHFDYAFGSGTRQTTVTTYDQTANPATSFKTVYTHNCPLSLHDGGDRHTEGHPAPAGL